MKRIEIKEPIPFPQAFDEISELGDYSRAAFLLCLGTLLCPSSNEVLVDLHDTAPFNLPYIKPLSTPMVAKRLFSEFRESSIYLEEFYNNESLMNEHASKLVNHLYMFPKKGRHLEQQENRLLAYQLLAIFMNHPNELLRISAAISWLDTVTAKSEALSILYASLKSENDLIRDMAYTALVRVNKGPKFRDSDPVPQAYVSNFDSFIVHGTIFSHPGKPYEKWWKPVTGDFHKYLKNGPRPNVYAGPNYFEWNGGWNDRARYEGVMKLMAWIDDHNMQNTEVFAHSHGCNVAMMASKYKKFSSLILMSCPVHWHLYKPNFNNIGKVLSIRVKWDFVIMADRGAQRFRDSRISETVLPLWFTAHDAARKSKTWQKENLDQLL